MGKTFNFKTNMDYKGTFDVSQIINAIKQLRKEMDNISNVKLLGNVDTEIAKVEKLRDTIQAQFEKGFTNQKEFNSFKSNIDKVFLGFEKVNQQFSNINTSEFNKKLEEIQDNINKLKKEAESMQKAFIGSFTAQKTGLKKTQVDQLKSQIANALKEEKSFLDIQKQVNNFFDQELKKQKESVELTKQQINLLEKQKAQIAARIMSEEKQGLFSNFATQPRMFKRNGESISKEELEALRMAYGRIVQEVNTAEQAQQRFLNLLKEENIQIQAEEGIKTRAAHNYEVYANALNNGTEEIKELTNQQNNLNKELKKSESVEQKINESREKTLTYLDSLSGDYNKVVYAVDNYNRAQENQNAEIEKANQAYEESETRVDFLKKLIKKQTENLKEASLSTQEAMDTQKKYNETLDQLKSRIGYVLSLSNAFYMLRNMIRQTWNDVQDLDKAFASIAMVTDKTVKDLWSTYDDYSTIANKLGQTTESAIQASALYYQQGLDTAAALELTEDTMKLATLADLDFKKATEQMTSALRGFHMEMDQGAHVTDVYSQLAANAAADVNGIAYAMSKTASIAQSSGMAFETTAAFLTNMIEATQEAPENLGTALKTIIARFTELKENISAADSEFDDLDYNKVDKALKSVGISLKDAQGQFRNLDDVFIELSSRWSSLDRNTQRYIATTAAGSRQQSRFLALMENYERTMELVETAQNSAGRSSEQFAKYQDTVKYKINQLQNSWEQFRTSLIETDTFKFFIEELTKLVEILQKIDLKNIPTILSLGTGIGTFTSSLKNGWKGVIQSIEAGMPAAKDILKEQGQKLVEFLDVRYDNLKGYKEDLKELNKSAEEFSARKIDIDTKNIPQKQQEIEELSNGISNLSEKIETFHKEDGTLIQGYQDQNDYLITSYKELIEQKQEEIQKRQENIGALEAESNAIDNTINKIKEETAETEKNIQETKKSIQSTQEKVANFFEKLSTPGLTQGLQIITSQIGFTFSMIKSGVSASQVAITTLSTAIAQGTPYLIKYGSAIAQINRAEKVLTIINSELTAEIGENITAQNIRNKLNETEILTESKQIILQELLKKATNDQTNAIVDQTVAMKLSEEATTRDTIAKLKNVAASSKVALIATAVVLAIAAISFAVYKAVEEWRNTHKTISQQLEDTKKQLEELEQQTTAAKNAAREAQEEYKKIGKIKDEYDSLSNKLVKTTEEQERWNTLITQIVEEYPEIVSYYDETNGKIEVQKDLWEDIIKLQKENAKQAQQTAAITAAGEYAVRAYQAQLTGKYDIEKAKRNLLKDKEGQKVISKIQNANLSNLTVEQGRAILNSNKEADLTRFLSYFGYTKESLISAEDYQKLFAEIQDNSSNGWKMVNKELDTIKEKAEKMEKTQAQYYQRMTEQALASSLVAGGMDTNVANLIARAASEQSKKGTNSLKTYSHKNIDNDLTWSGKIRNLGFQFLGANLGTMVSPGWGTLIGAELGRTYASDYFLANDFAAWDELKKEERDILTDLNYTREEWNKTDRKNLAADKSFVAKFNAAYGQQKAQEAALVISDYLETDSALKEALESYATSYMDMTADEIEDSAIGLKEQINAIEDEETKWYFNEIIDKSGYAENLREIQDTIAVTLGKSSNLYKNWTYNESSAYLAWIQKNLTQLGTDRGQEYTQKINDLFVGKDLSGTQIDNILNSIDFRQATATTWEGFQDSAIESIETIMNYSEEEAIEFFNRLAKDSKEYGVLDLTIANEEELEKFNESLKETADAIANIKSDLISLNAKINTGDLGLDYDTYISLKEKLEAVGKSIGDYTTIDDQGNIALKNTEALKNLYSELLEGQKQKYQMQIDENNARVAEINLEITNISLEEERLRAEIQANGQIAKGVNYYVLMNEEIIKTIKLLNLLGANIDLKGITAGELREGTAEEAYEEWFRAAEAKKSALRIEAENIINYSKTLADNQKLIDKENLANQKDYDNKVIEETNKLTEEETKIIEDASNKVVEAEKKVEEATKKLYETLYGTEYHKNKLDTLYNYTSMLEEIQRQIDKTKEKIDDFTTEDLSGSLSEYQELLRKESSIYQAEKRVYEQSNANYREQLNTGIAEQIKHLNSIGGYNIDTDVSKYYYTNPLTGLLDVNFQTLNAANLPDEISDLIETVIDEINKGTKKIQEIDDAMEKRQKEIKEFGEKVVDNYVKVEDEVIKVLKDKYQEEIDANKAKNDAMAESDSEYLDALEAAIKKQRDLRDRQNQWETLAQKERKAALLQRDTSGANAAELRNLTEEIESDREKLLDDTVDSILDNLKEMYELQKEQREEQLEFLEQTLDEQQIIREAVEAISSWTSTEDAVAWMMENNKEISEMSDAKLEQQAREWEELYNAANLYYNYDGSSIQNALNGNFEEVEGIYREVSEAQTAEAERLVGEVGENVSQNIIDARDALIDAQEALKEALEEQTEILEKIYNKDGEGQDGNWGSKTYGTYKNITEAQRAAAELVSQGAGKAYTNVGIQKLGENSYAVRYDDAIKQVVKNNVSNQELGDVNTTAWEDYSKSTYELNPQQFHEKLKVNKDSVFYKKAMDYIGDGSSLKTVDKKGNVIKDDFYKYVMSLYNSGTSLAVVMRNAGIWNPSDGNPARTFYNTMVEEWISENSGIVEKYSREGMSLTKDNLGYYEWKKYASGGLVNYTGPAWVDGSPSKPEAFLSSEDTQRIGAAAKLLASLPFFSSSIPDSLSQIIGDTNIEVHINVDSIASDYDVDQAVERVKKDILDAARPIGSSIILSK